MAISFDRPLRGALHGAAPEPAPTVIIAHGFKAFMGWGMFPWIADRLAEAGLAAIRFDFSHNGADENGEFTHLDRFSANTFSKEQEDLGLLVDAVAGESAPFGGHCRPLRIGLLGHSRGGGGVILNAAADRRIAAVATMASIAAANRFPPGAREIAERDGFYPVPNARTGQLMPVGLAAFEDAERHDIPAAARSIDCPFLVVHGDADGSVPIGDAHTLRRCGATLLEIPGATHTFGAVHPFLGPTPELEQAVDAIAGFFRTALA